MRYKLYFNLENSKMPIDYRRNIISYIKLSLSEYNEDYFKKYYNEKDNIIKSFSFSVFFKKPQITSEEIIVEDKKFELNITIEDYETAIILFNAFNRQLHKKFSINQNSWTLQNIAMMMEKEVKSNSVDIKFQSPLCVRSRQNNKDYYYSYEHKEFEEMLKVNIRQQLKITNFSEDVVDSFKITPIEAKKVVIRFYEKQIECSTGKFNIKGDKKLLEYLYKSGVGSRHSAGFGMFQII